MKDVTLTVIAIISNIIITTLIYIYKFSPAVTYCVGFVAGVVFSVIYDNVTNRNDP